MTEISLLALAIWIVTFLIGNYLHKRFYNENIFINNDKEYILICAFFAPVFMIVMLFIRFKN